MYILRRQLDFRVLKSAIKFYSLARKTHYEVLKVRKNCTDKQIKEAFIKMSKAYHPDKNKDGAAQENFIRIVEAYNILSKPSSRAIYDSSMETQGTTFVYRTHVPYNIRRNQYNYQYQSQTEKTKNTAENKGSYGTYSTYSTSGSKKVPNYIVILVCCGFAMFGCLVQMYIIREMYIAQRQQAIEKSRKNSEELNRVRALAQTSTNEMQTQVLLEKIVAASNPTVATASLGQALASEKKDTATLLTEFGVSEMINEDIPATASYKSYMEGYRPTYAFQRWCLH